MPVTNEHRVDLTGGDPFQQPRHDRLANVNQQPEPVMLTEVAAARLARLRPAAATAEHCQPHPKDSTGWPVTAGLPDSGCKGRPERADPREALFDSSSHNVVDGH